MRMRETMYTERMVARIQGQRVKSVTWEQGPKLGQSSLGLAMNISDLLEFFENDEAANDTNINTCYEVI